MQPEEIWAKELRRQLDGRTAGRRIGASVGCVYVLYDFDEEPLYVGKSTSAGENVGTRIRRHLINRRADAVAKGVFSPFEVQAIKIFFLRRPAGARTKLSKGEVATVASYERYLYETLTARAARPRRGRKGVPPLPPLNESPPKGRPWRRRTVPPSVRFSIVPPEIETALGAREVRIERWAEMIRRVSGSIRVADSAKTRRDLESVLHRQLKRVDALL